MTPPRIQPPLTGDVKADYDSGARTNHALDHWVGCWCEMFLIPDSNVSTFNGFETRSLEDVRAGRANISEIDLHPQLHHAVRRQPEVGRRRPRVA